MNSSTNLQTTGTVVIRDVTTVMVDSLDNLMNVEAASTTVTGTSAGSNKLGREDSVII